MKKMMNYKKLTKSISTIVLLLISSVGAWELAPFDDLPFSYQYIYNQTIDFSRNPALFNADIQRDSYFYQFYNDYTEKEFYPFRVSQRDRTYGATFYAAKLLDEKSVLTAAFKYNYEKYYNMSHSLEKHFYEDYFSFSDSTIGNTAYHGPQMWLMYNRKVFSNIRAGLEVNYGIERGLKDEYTECMTIFRNTSFKGGLSYISTNNKLKIGLYGRYFNRQGKYEAVENLMPATNFTYIGYHLVRLESKGTEVNKSGFRNGGEGGLDIYYSGILVPFLDYKGFFGIGGMNNDNEGGDASRPQKRGYWVRESMDIKNRLIINLPVASTSVSAEYGFQKIDDWGKLGYYDVLCLVNYQKVNYLDLEFRSFPGNRLDLRFNTVFAKNSIDYSEYTADFYYQDNLSSMAVSCDMGWHINPVLTLESGYGYSDVEPWYYWNTESIVSNKVYFGWRILTTRGVYGVRFLWQKDNNILDKNNETFQLILNISN